MRAQAITAAALIAMRDGDGKLRAANAAWARGIFANVLQNSNDAAPRFRSGLRFNPIAMAFVGTVHLAKHQGRPEDLRAILEIGAHDDPSAAHGFGAVIDLLVSIDERLPRAVLRCGFASSIWRRRRWDAKERRRLADAELRRRRLGAAVDAEMAWLRGSGPEPDWPAFPDEQPRRREPLRISGGSVEPPMPHPKRSDEYADHQAAALWLTNVKSVGDVSKNTWLRDIARAYSRWTMAANGAGLEKSESISQLPMEWNDAYFDSLARVLPGLSVPEIEELALEPLTALPDESFFDAVADFVPSVDVMHFGGHDLTSSAAVCLRTRLAERLMASRGWEWIASSRSTSIELHIAPAIAALFFNQHGFAQPPECYLLPIGVDRLPPFLPVLGKLVQSGPSLFVARVMMNLLEVSPRPDQLAFMVAAAKALVDSHPDDTEFWVDHGIGRRICLWAENLCGQDATLFSEGVPLRPEVDRIVAALVRLGVVEARHLEQSLAQI